MSGNQSVSLELLQGMVQRVLDAVTMLREDNQHMRRRLSRIESAMARQERAIREVGEAATDQTEGRTRCKSRLMPSPRGSTAWKAGRRERRARLGRIES